MRIREAVPSDASDIASVHVRSWQAAYRGQLPDEFLDGLSVGEREAMWRSGLSDPGPWRGCFVAEDAGGRTVGFVAFGPARDEHGPLPADTGEVYAIYVAPDAFGTGVGRELFARAGDALRERGFRTAVLWVLESNEQARRFYEVAGWKPDGAVTTERIDCLNYPTVRYRVGLG